MCLVAGHDCSLLSQPSLDRFMTWFQMESPPSPEEPVSARRPIYRSMISLRTLNSGDDDALDSQPLVAETVPRGSIRKSRKVS